MKFIKQLSQDEFVVKLGPEDTDNTRSIVLAHDYLQINGRDWHCTDMHGLKAPWAFGNVVHTHASVQIPIRMAQDILENVLTSDRKYLKKEHLVHENGEPVYNDPNGLSYKYKNDNGIEMIAIYSGKNHAYIHLPLDTYNTIKNLAKDDEAKNEQ